MKIWWFILWSYRLLFSWRRPTLYVVLETIIIHWIKICVNRQYIPSDRPNSIPGRFDTKFCFWGPFHCTGVQCWECVGVLHILDLVLRVPSPPALSVHSHSPCLDTLEKERTQFASLLNLGCQCFFVFPELCPENLHMEHHWNINVDDFQTFCSRNHATTCFPAICVFGPLGIRYSFPLPTFFHIAYFKYSAWTVFCYK